MGEDAACVEMSLLREQKTTNNSTRKIMTLADMRMANMNECSPQFSHICVLTFALALALTCGPSPLLQNSNHPGRRSNRSWPRAARSLILIVGPFKVE